METVTTETSPKESFGTTAGMVWQKTKWIVKGCIVGMMAILFMIPMVYVKDLILEREERQREVVNEISGKWAGAQNIAGPVLCVPYLQTEYDADKKPMTVKHIASFLPESLNISSTVTPIEKHRGIFKVMLYNSKTTLAGSFAKLPIEKLNIPADKFTWSEAYVKLTLTDIKGLDEPVKLKWKDSLLELSPQTDGNIKSGLSSPLTAVSIDDVQNISFSADIDLKGSEQLLFTPLGRSTTVNVNSTWKEPSFNGSSLPQATELSDSGFTATWKGMSHTRNFPQQWIDDAIGVEAYIPPAAYSSSDADVVRIAGPDAGYSANSVNNSAFGVNLFIPVNGYQKTMRTVKYAILCILLTFAAFFLIETVHKKSAHPFQYGLVGLALVLFYTLLLSFSEYTGFNTAYLIASIATIGLIAWFVKGILQSAKPATILSVVLVLIYSYVFSILQLQDYALLFGSIGLFLTLAVIMYFSRKISW